MEPSIQLTFSYEKGEYARACRAHYRRVLNPLRDGSVIAAALGFGAYLWFNGGPQWLALTLFGTASLLALMLASAFTIIPQLIARSSPKLCEPYELGFGPEGILFRTPSIDSKLQWSLYQSWSEDPEFYTLYVGKRDWTVIPRRAFSDPLDEAEFRELLERNIGPGGR